MPGMRVRLVSLSALAVVACGGGDGNNSGSNPPAPQYSDGLGESGRVSDAQAISNGLPVYWPLVTLDDSGRGMIVWSDAIVHHSVLRRGE